jgi:RimJ/RimL family protein N-acetyltransferase
MCVLCKLLVLKCSYFEPDDGDEDLSTKITPFPTGPSYNLTDLRQLNLPGLRPGQPSSGRNFAQHFKAVEANFAKKPIGFIYLAASPLSNSPPDQIGELNLGIILQATHRGKGYGREAIQLVVKHAFNVQHCHRIQASLLRSSNKDRMVSLLTQLCVIIA